MVAERWVVCSSVPLFETRDIFARAECSSCPGDDYASGLRVFLCLFERGVEFFSHRIVEGVEGRWPVKRDSRYLVLLLDDDGFVSHLYRPLNCAGLFSVNALIPSFMSSVENRR